MPQLCGVRLLSARDLRSGADLLEGAPGLVDVKAVVAGDQAERQLVALGAPLGVDAIARSLRDRRPAPEGKVRRTQGGVKGEELRGIGIAMVETPGPEVLVVPGDRRRVVGEDPAVTAARDELRIGNVPEEFDDRPLAGCRRRAQVRAGVGDERRDLGEGPPTGLPRGRRRREGRGASPGRRSARRPDQGCAARSSSRA